MIGDRHRPEGDASRPDREANTEGIALH